RGLILDIGSFAGQAPTPLLATYSGSKAFFIGWAQAPGEELERHRITVRILNTYFVVSNMGKVRKSSAVIPTPKRYVAQVLTRLGSSGGAVGLPYTSTDLPAHATPPSPVEHPLIAVFGYIHDVGLLMDQHPGVRHLLQGKIGQDAHQQPTRAASMITLTPHTTCCR
ncbi:hypothetical protein V8E36_008909, partial [Tilletia maclaganii]